ncbi:MAG: acylneuraminate cytidylyltransferase family protein [Rhodothermales bacterium]|nr:acylneuraminate cytidylyltransferase family protein [Rhodothermales bacterium]
MPAPSAPRIAALVPMRHHSERVPGKNYRPFCGEPLYRHVVRALLACPRITDVVIDTDSPAIRDDAAACFPAVRVLERPPHLRDGATPMNDVLLHTVRRVEADLYLQTHSTNPLLRPETIARALARFDAEAPRHDSLFSVTRLQTRLWDAAGRPVNHDPAVLLRTQDLEPLYEENSCLYLFSRDTLERRGNRIGARPMRFEIAAEEAWDIDEELDFRVAEFLFAHRHEPAESSHEGPDLRPLHDPVRRSLPPAVRGARRGPRRAHGA